MLNEESKIDKKLQKTLADEIYSHRKMHRELSKYDKKDALEYEIAKYRRKYEGLKQVYKERIEGIKEKLKKFYVDKIEQKKTLIR